MRSSSSNAVFFPLPVDNLQVNFPLINLLCCIFCIKAGTLYFLLYILYFMLENKQHKIK